MSPESVLTFGRQGLELLLAVSAPMLLVALAVGLIVSVLQALTQSHGVRTYGCDAADADSVAALFDEVTRDLGAPRLVVHNIDGRVPGIFRKGITEADPALALDTLRNAAFSAFLVGQQAARLLLDAELA